MGAPVQIVGIPPTRSLRPQSINAFGKHFVGVVTAVVTMAMRRTRRSKRTPKSCKAVATGAVYQTLCKDDDGPDSMRRRFENLLAEAQEQICAAIEEVDGKGKFCRDPYTRNNGGGGVARVLADGDVFEKAGCNLSVVYGEMPEAALKAATERGANRDGLKLEPGQKVPFFAAGLSSVIHPKNPYCPTLHFNYRYFETNNGIFWFGGGTDITPSYLDIEDMKHFHGTHKAVCDQFNKDWYPRFKTWADNYFVIKHRGETRGLGGIFFDDFNTEDPEIHLAFSAQCLKAATKAYVPILEKNKDKAFTQEQKAWQQLRRGRYVEFNLVYDRGTTFGLQMLSSGVGRVESILMSLPKTASWEYCHEPTEGSPEAEIMKAFREPREWVC